MSPPAIQRSYRARKSSLLTAAAKDGGIGGELVGGALDSNLSQTMLAHEGTAQESTPSTPGEGEAWETRADPARLYLPSPSHGGEAEWRGEYCV